jgi:myo-inositol-1(or 4)-monophosphatase
MPSLHGELAFARELSRQAGEVLIRHFGSGFAVQMKGFADPVTIADRESESLIRSAILRAYPADGLDGEEEGSHTGSSGRLWLIDPLDGTANYAGGLPGFAVVFALIDEADPRRALLNVTYDPIRGETFHAIRGEGAFLDDRPIRVSAMDYLAGALVHLHYSNNPRVWEQSVELARRISRVAPHARTLGSSALAQAYVANGRLSAHAKLVSGMYDVIGGNLLIEEAGGIVTGLDGQPWQPLGTLLAACPGVHPLLLPVVAGVGDAES